jgi:hypothetical protein
MGPSTSPNEPLFFLHHANVDRVWAKVRHYYFHCVEHMLTSITVAGP